MADIHKFREASLKLGTDNLTFVVDAYIEEKWDTVTFPMYMDESPVRSLPTLKRITATLRRKFHESSPLYTAIDGSPGTLEFKSEGTTINFTSASVISWKVYGESGGEMMEEAELALEE